MTTRKTRQDSAGIEFTPRFDAQPMERRTPFVNARKRSPRFNQCDTLVSRYGNDRRMC